MMRALRDSVDTQDDLAEANRVLSEMRAHLNIEELEAFNSAFIKADAA